MGIQISNFFYNEIKCVYCNAKVSDRISICYIHSRGKLNNLYVCNICLLNKNRRNDFTVLKTYNEKFKKEYNYIL